MTIVEIEWGVVAIGAVIVALTILADWPLIFPKEAKGNNDMTEEMDCLESTRGEAGRHDDAQPCAQDISVPARIAQSERETDEVVGLITFVEVLKQLRGRQGQDPAHIRYAFSEVRG